MAAVAETPVGFWAFWLGIGFVLYVAVVWTMVRIAVRQDNDRIHETAAEAGTRPDRKEPAVPDVSYDRETGPPALSKQTLAVIAGAIVLLVVGVVGAIAFTGGSESDPSGPVMTMPDGSTMPTDQMTTDGMTMTNGETMP